MLQQTNDNLLSQANARIAPLVTAIEQVLALIEPPNPSDDPHEWHPIILPGRLQVVPGLEMIEEAAELRTLLNALNQGLFSIQVLGTFKNGKSTLLNAMLGSKLLPARNLPTTAVITVVVGGERQDVAIYRYGTDDPEFISFEEFRKEYQIREDDTRTIDTAPNRFAEIEYAQIETEHWLCANRVRLIDSPGLDEHTSRTTTAERFLKSVQAVIYVLNATRILSQNEMALIEDKLGDGRLEHVFFCDQPSQSGRQT
ncbi:MAG: hypothetical protein HC828_21130 [Blastochloris sp.]|nr:hypothetical protein [Blastochloris sp.]